MHITFPHPDRLETRKGRTSALLTLAAGTVITSVGLLVGLQLAKFTQLRCDRTPEHPVNCQWHSHGLYQHQQQTLTHLTQARVETQRPLNPRYRLQLHSESGQFPFTPHYTRDKSNVQALADQINRFIADAQMPSLSIQLDRRWLGSIWGSSLMLLGFWGWYRALWRSTIHLFRVDRGSGLIQVEYRSLLRHCRTNQYFLEDVVITHIHRPRADCPPQLSLFLRTGDVLSLQLPHHLDAQTVEGVLQFWGAIAQEVSN